MNITSGIYKITNLINNKIYVGSAVNLYRREIQHFFHLKRKSHHNKHLQSSYNKYGEGNFVFEILELVEDKSQLISHEQFYIDDLNPKYNKCKVAGSPLGVKHSDSYKENCRLRMKGCTPWNKGLSGYFTEEQKKSIGVKSKATKIKNGTFAKSPSEQTKQKRAETIRLNPFKHNKETLNVMSNIKKKYYESHSGPRKNQIVSIETRIKQSLAASVPKPYNRKPIIQLDLQGNFIAEFVSIKIAQLQLNIKSIHEALSGRNKTAGGFKWQYITDYKLLLNKVV